MGPVQAASTSKAGVAVAPAFVLKLDLGTGTIGGSRRNFRVIPAGCDGGVLHSLWRNHRLVKMCVALMTRVPKDVVQLPTGARWGAVDPTRSPTGTCSTGQRLDTQKSQIWLNSTEATSSDESIVTRCFAHHRVIILSRSHEHPQVVGHCC